MKKYIAPSTEVYNVKMTSFLAGSDITVDAVDNNDDEVTHTANGKRNNDFGSDENWGNDWDD